MLEEERRRKEEEEQSPVPKLRMGVTITVVWINLK